VLVIAKKHVYDFLRL